MKFTNKEYLAILLVFVLAILLGQTKFLRFFFDTHLGRSFLVLFVIIITYLHKTLGVISVLLIVIMFQQGVNSINLFESFTDSSSKNDIKKKDTDAATITDTIKTKSVEGFDIIGLEDTMKKSKQSNTLSVNDFSRTSENAEPFSTYDSYTPF
jgi:ABC-type protease/lipase transport system fused ATPase/permease subunit